MEKGVSYGTDVILVSNLALRNLNLSMDFIQLPTKVEIPCPIRWCFLRPSPGPVHSGFLLLIFLEHSSVRVCSVPDPAWDTSGSKQGKSPYPPSFHSREGKQTAHSKHVKEVSYIIWFKGINPTENIQEGAHPSSRQPCSQ